MAESPERDLTMELLEYLHLQFPATIGHIPLHEKLLEIKVHLLLGKQDRAELLKLQNQK